MGSISITITGPGISAPITGTFPSDTARITVDVPVGKSRLLELEAKLDTPTTLKVTSYGAQALFDVSTGGTVYLNVHLVPFRKPVIVQSPQYSPNPGYTNGWPNVVDIGTDIPSAGVVKVPNTSGIVAPNSGPNFLWDSVVGYDYLGRIISTSYDGSVTPNVTTIKASTNVGVDYPLAQLDIFVFDEALVPRNVILDANGKTLHVMQLVPGDGSNLDFVLSKLDVDSAIQSPVTTLPQGISLNRVKNAQGTEINIFDGYFDGAPSTEGGGVITSVAVDSDEYYYTGYRAFQNLDAGGTEIQYFRGFVVKARNIGDKLQIEATYPNNLDFAENTRIGMTQNGIFPLSIMKKAGKIYVISSFYPADLLDDVEMETAGSYTGKSNVIGLNAGDLTLFAESGYGGSDPHAGQSRINNYYFGDVFDFDHLNPRWLGFLDWNGPNVRFVDATYPDATNAYTLRLWDFDLELKQANIYPFYKSADGVLLEPSPEVTPAPSPSPSPTL